MKLLEIYHAHPISGMFTGKGYADPDPMGVGGWLIPAHAYLDKPPVLSTSQVALRVGGAWVVVVNNVGKVYYTSDGVKHKVLELGVEVPEDSTPEPLPPSLHEQKQAKRVQINQWRADAEGLGMEYVFPDGSMDNVQVRNERDLANINAQVLAAVVIQSSGVSDPVLVFRAQSDVTYSLTPEQVITLGMSVSGFCSGLYKIGWDLKAAVDAARDSVALEAIVWPAQEATAQE